MATKDKVVDLSRPSVEVRVEAVHIGIAELAYLRALTQPKALRCHPSSKTLDKLRFLDLIARANLQPTPEAMKEWADKLRHLEMRIKAAFTRKDWQSVGDAAYDIQRHVKYDKPKPVEDDVLTEKGKQLLAQGNATVRVRKVGCVE